MITGLLAEHCQDPVADLVEFRQRYAGSLTPESSLFAGVREGLRELESWGYALAICSNKPQNLCDKVLDDLGLAGLFDAVVGSRPGLRPKPYTDLLDATLHQLGTGPQRCAFIGDSDLDQSIAHAGGLPFLFVSYGYADEAMRTERLTRFASFPDLVDWVKVTYGGSQRLRNVA
jgi:phosphoglycolate phosphatase